MKLNKLFILAGIAVAGLFVACSDDDFSAGPQATGEQVYIPSDFATTIKLDVKASSFDIPVYRMATDAATIPVEVYTNSKILTVPTSVTFKEGETKSALTVSYNPADIVVGQYDSLKVTFKEDVSTPYGLSSVTFLVGVDEPWNSLGMGKFADYGWMDNAPYEVEFQQSGLYPTHFRVVEPYTPAYKNEGWSGAKPGAYLNFRILKPGDNVNGVEITQENLIYFEPCVTGYYVSDYSATLILRHPGDFTTISKEPVSEAHFVYNKVNEYQENGLPAIVGIAPMWYMQGVGSYSYWNTQYVELTFPGVATYDYSVGVTYTGQFTDTYGDKYACAEAELGADIAKAYYAVGKGKDASSLLQAIMAGEVECDSITASGEIKAAMPEDAETGDYTIMVVGYDANGEAQEYDYESFKYTASGETPETWTPAYVGTYTYTLFFGSKDEPYEDAGLVMSVSDKNENRFKISHIFNDVDFVFEMDPETGALSFEDQEVGYEYQGASIWVADMVPYGLEAGTYSQGVFTFSIGYHNGAKFLTYGKETFALTGKADAAKVRAAAPKKKAYALNQWGKTSNISLKSVKMPFFKALLGTPVLTK